jgi:hypothetical protein
MFLRLFLFSKGTLLTEITMTLRTLFESEGAKKEGEEKNSSRAQAKRGRRERTSLTTQENF